MYLKYYFEYLVELIIEQGYIKIIICTLFMTKGTDYDVFIERMERYEELNIKSDKINILVDTLYTKIMLMQN